jgi:branched-chain amino acid transport system substrate-binding protein
MNTRIRMSVDNSPFHHARKLLLIGIASLLLISCNDKPIVVGFVAQLTGKQAELGVQERNGVQLAIEKINAAGGISGRKIELLIRDDLGMPEGAKSADEELIKAGVVAIIGHATSGQTLSGLKVTNPAKVVMISPTVSTPVLSDLDDYFFRVYPTFKESSQAFAQYIFKTDGIKRLAIIYDTDNAAYARAFRSTFSEKFISLGGTISGESSFSSSTHPDFPSLLSKLRDNNADGMLIIASDIDSALIAQRARIMDWQVPLFTSAWAQTETLINNGGKAVEGIKLEQSYALSSQVPSFIEFKANFKSRFGNSPSFGAAFSYEATMVLAEALKKTGGNSDNLETHDFKGVMDSFSINKFGDVQRPFYLSTIQDGKYVILGKLN